MGIFDTPVDDELDNSSDEPSYYDHPGTPATPNIHDNVNSSSEPSVKANSVNTLIPGNIFGSDEAIQSGLSQKGADGIPVDKVGTIIDTPIDNLEQANISSNEVSGLDKVETIDNLVDDLEQTNSTNKPSGFGKPGILDTPMVSSSNEPSSFGKVVTYDTRVDDELANSSDEPSYYDHPGTPETPNIHDNVNSSSEPSVKANSVNTLIPGNIFGSDEAIQSGLSQKGADGIPVDKVGTIIDTPIDNLEQANISSNEVSGLDKVETIDNLVDDLEQTNSTNKPSGFGKVGPFDTPMVNSSNESSGFGKVGSLDTPVDDNDIPRIDHFNISDEPRYFDQQGKAETPDYKLDKVIPGISFGSDEASQGGFSQKEAVGTPVDNLKQVNSSNEPSVLDQELMVETPEDDKREVAETEKKPDSFSKACPEASNLDGWDFSNDFGFLERPFLDDPNPEVKEETVALEDLDDQFPEEVRFLRELNQRLDDLDQMFKTLKEQVDDNTKKISVLEGRNFNKGSNS